MYVRFYWDCTLCRCLMSLMFFVCYFVLGCLTYSVYDLIKIHTNIKTTATRTLIQSCIYKEKHSFTHIVRLFHNAKHFIYTNAIIFLTHSASSSYTISPAQCINEVSYETIINIQIVSCVSKNILIVFPWENLQSGQR